MLIDVGGVRWDVLAYLEGALESDSDAPPLVLLHGFAGSGAGWWNVLPALGADRVAFAPDLVGHAGSDAPDDPRPYAWRTVVQQLVGLLDQLGADQVDLVGYSLGGRLALGLALQAPRRVRRLVLEGASPGLRDAGERAERAQRDGELADRIQKEGVEAFAAWWGAQPLFATQRALPAGAQAGLRAERMRHTAHGLAHALRGLGTGNMPPLWERLGELRMPTLLVAGEQDLKFRAVLDEARDRLPEARRVDIAGVGHRTHLEQPQAFAAVVREFLA